MECCALLCATTAFVPAFVLRPEAAPVRGRASPWRTGERITTPIGRLDAHFTAIGGGDLLTAPLPTSPGCVRRSSAPPTDRVTDGGQLVRL
ncbi:hypothetical protein QF048_006924 [Streptomyces sp. W4I9-2]|nr:hypothetical protein [Streptomyces sp. W4I9-2]